MATKVVVNRSLHITCNNIFYEIEDQERSRCPHCKGKLSRNNVKLASSKEVKIDPVTGNLSFE